MRFVSVTAAMTPRAWNVETSTPPIHHSTVTKSDSVVSRARASAKTSTPEVSTSIQPRDRGIATSSRSTLDKLGRLGITRELDLLLHLPLRYDDETRLYSINEAPPGQDVLVQGRVVECEVKYRPRRQLVCHIEDGSGVLTLRFFTFYPSQLKQLARGTLVRVFGEIRHGFFGAEVVHPRYKVVRGDSPVAKSLTPVYPTTAGLGQDTLRQLIERALAHCDTSDTLPPKIVAPLKLPRFRDALLFLHNPPPEVLQEDLQSRQHPAWQRMKFDELLAQQLSMRLHYRKRKTAGAPVLQPKRALTPRLLDCLPFALTEAQQRAWREIERDLAQPYPMQRLLQGDVGSGKTVVAALAALQAVENGAQVAVMAPTELLAEQHYRKFAAWLTELGVRVTWLAGGLRKREKLAALEATADGTTQVAVGTHALFQEDVRFSRLALAIVDEQHRFGVHQRLALRLKGTWQESGAQPHQLMMSATPIPRTLAMSYYADLDVSIIDELPPGRTPVATKLVSDARRDEVIQRVRDACIAGAQAYWVCPLIEDSEKLQLETAVETHETLKAAFPELSVGLVHGRLKSDHKAAVMASFQSGEIQLLVATTVIEVGVDVPNATLMVIEHAERMGLSQLHQLRGRVGRGSRASACILLYQKPLTPTARDRLQVIYENHDGFEVARHDLRVRGPGELLGARQSGVPMLRFADLSADAKLLERARDIADKLLRD
ncbi:MAG TPA: ATP-dependent DNA helicase RecG, partial [Burkholderiales bacterium]|nr:ATP-dependent DNA helicase RecG [Burkholderiales bacterium]